MSGGKITKGDAEASPFYALKVSVSSFIFLKSSFLKIIRDTNRHKPSEIIVTYQIPDPPNI